MADPDFQIRRGPGHPDPEIRGAARSLKIFFRPFRPRFGLKIRRGGGRGSGPPLLVAEGLLVYSLSFSKSEILNSALPLLAERQRRSFLGSLAVFSYSQVREPVE